MYNRTSPIIHSHRKNFEFVYGDVRNHEQLLPYVEEGRCNYSSWHKSLDFVCDRDKDLVKTLQ